MGEDRQQLIVNLSGDQKKALGFASWTQISISAVGLILGVLGFSVIRWLLKMIGAGLGTSVIIALSLIHISEPTRLYPKSRMPSSA